MPSDLPDATVRYAAHEDAVIDVHLPGGSPPTGPDTPLVVLLHGGFWKQEWDRRHTRAQARALSDLGLVVTTPEYRRVRGGGGWPATGDDVHLAVRRLPDLLAGLGIATGSTAYLGHSAGGHLALWLATRDVPVDSVVALAAVCDLGEAIRLRLGYDATVALLGGADPAVADPMVLLADRPAADVHLVHGVDDDDVPVSLSRGLAERYPWITLHEVPGGHMEVIEPGSVSWPTVIDALGFV
jgi:dipeptidyl aminopeptidase/acylaminoacyl peptidase